MVSIDDFLNIISVETYFELIIIVHFSQIVLFCSGLRMVQEFSIYITKGSKVVKNDLIQKRKLLNVLLLLATLKERHQTRLNDEHYFTNSKIIQRPLKSYHHQLPQPQSMNSEIIFFSYSLCGSYHSTTSSRVSFIFFKSLNTDLFFPNHRTVWAQEVALLFGDHPIQRLDDQMTGI